MFRKIRVFERRCLGLLAGLLLYFRAAGRQRADSARMSHLEFGTSTQAAGIRFTERLRNVFRLRWLRIYRGD